MIWRDTVELSRLIEKRLHVGADHQRYLATASILIEAGARAEASVFGVTALSIAEEAQFQPLIDMFREAARSEKDNEKAAKKRKL